jgi:predicted component of type VI protein secretion system
MSALPATSQTKLAKLLGMLGSDHAGERDAAAVAAHRLVTQAGVTWRQVVSPPAIEKALPELGTWRQTVAECLAQRGSLRAWEVKFLHDLPGFRRLSTKQRYCLKEIADRVLKRVAA